MEAVTIHKLNDKLVVSLAPLPGFKKMGSCVIRDKEGKKSGSVAIYYTGPFFTDPEGGCFTTMQNGVLRLAKNYAVKTSLGVASTRLNLSLALRETHAKKQKGVGNVRMVQETEPAAS